MKYVAASAAKKSFASLIDAAAHEPVVIRRRKLDVAVLLSMREYRRLTQPNMVELNMAEFQHFCDQFGQRAADAGLSEFELDRLLRTAGDD